jgi:hypothetical protein
MYYINKVNQAGMFDKCLLTLGEGRGKKVQSLVQSLIELTRYYILKVISREIAALRLPYEEDNQGLLCVRKMTARRPLAPHARPSRRFLRRRGAA